MKKISLVRGDPGLAELAIDGRRVSLERLCGIALQRGGPAKTAGLAVLSSSLGHVEGDQWMAEQLSADANTLRVVMAAHDGAVQLETTWEGCAETGVVSRCDRLVNCSRAVVTVFQCQVRVALPPALYEVYAQDSRWCNESQGAWLPLHAGTLTLSCVPGRTSQGGTPYACLRRMGAKDGLAFHVLPVGNWAIHFRNYPVGDCPLLPVVELGLADENLCVRLDSGGVLELPEILFQPLPEGEPHLAAPLLHRFLLKRRFTRAKPAAAVIYNTWFDQFEILDVPRLRKQLAAAKAAGCEVFVIDAGWYGAGDGNWWEQAGDWREKTKSAFKGRMRGFAAEVRRAGLGFGIWMETERFGAAAPIRKEHPEWFIPRTGAARIDLTIPEAYRWQKAEVARLVKTYGLAWMKIDFNFEMERDESGMELAAYYREWYRLLDEIRAEFPKTFFEGCASGAMRTDIESLQHFDNTFLSDTVNPVDSLRIMQGTYLRLLPGRIGRWAVIRSAGRSAPRYGKRVQESAPMLLTPCGAVWEPSETTDLDFAVLAAMPGMLGFSGDLAGLPMEVAAPLTKHIARFKRWRRMIAGSVAHLLTPPELIGVRTGWVGFQFQGLSRKENLVFVYRLGVAGDPPVWRLRDLDPQRKYEVRAGLDSRGPKQVLQGRVLMSDGLAIAMPPVGGSKANAAAVCSVVAVR